MRRAPTDKRRHPRFDGSGLWARMKLDGALGEVDIENVSLGGALVSLNRPCAPGKNVLLELRGAQRDLRLVGRIIDVVPRGRGRPRHGARIRFNPIGASSTNALYALIRGLPKDMSLNSCPTDPEAFEFHEIKLRQTMDFDIDVEEPEYELSDVVDEPTVAA